MARLETEINQIYLTHPENKKSSLILYEEEISNSAHLFILAELKDLHKKSEAGELKKISEIILESFRLNKRLAAEAMFESSLAQINQNLADLAHEGRKSWVGKFSCLIALKSGENIYVANNGQAQAFLLRNSELVEILKAEKRGTHPLKSFMNFTQGRIASGDGLILTVSSIFNYISLELFNRMLAANPLPQAAAEISKILKESMGTEEGFGLFLLSLGKKDEMPKKTKAAVVAYEPLPEEVELETPSTWQMPAIPNLPNIKLPSVKLPKVKIPKLEFFRNLSTPGKFFFISFALFALLFVGNLIRYGWHLHGRTQADRVTAQANQLATDMANAQSSTIYKNDSDALKFLNLAEADYQTLQGMDSAKASEFTDQLDKLKDQINKVSIISDPKVFVDLKHNPTYLTKTGIGLLLANTDSNSLSLYDGKNLTDYFLLNSLKEKITGINYSTLGSSGVVVASGNGIYHINTTLKQFEPIANLDQAALMGLESYNNAVYSLNTSGNQVVKLTFSKNKFVTTFINVQDLTNIRDFGLDKDTYLLYPDKLLKLSGNNLQAFPYPALTDQISNASKIVVASNLYILEANKKRVVILNKNGQLLNQIYLPSLSNPQDLSVDEGSRSLYLLDDNNKLYKITF